MQAVDESGNVWANVAVIPPSGQACHMDPQAQLQHRHRPRVELPKLEANMLIMTSPRLTCHVGPVIQQQPRQRSKVALPKVEVNVSDLQPLKSSGACDLQPLKPSGAVRNVQDLGLRLATAMEKENEQMDRLEANLRRLRAAVDLEVQTSTPPTAPPTPPWNRDSIKVDQVLRHGGSIAASSVSMPEYEMKTPVKSQGQDLELQLAGTQVRLREVMSSCESDANRVKLLEKSWESELADAQSRLEEVAAARAADKLRADAFEKSLQLAPTEAEALVEDTFVADKKLSAAQEQVKLMVAACEAEAIRVRRLEEMTALRDAEKTRLMVLEHSSELQSLAVRQELEEVSSSHEDLESRLQVAASQAGANDAKLLHMMERLKQSEERESSLLAELTESSVKDTGAIKDDVYASSCRAALEKIEVVRLLAKEISACLDMGEIPSSTLVESLGHAIEEADEERASLEASPYKIGDVVEMRDNVESIFFDGVVVSLDPLRVRFATEEEGHEGYEWREVQKPKASSSNTASKAFCIESARALVAKCLEDRNACHKKVRENTQCQEVRRVSESELTALTLSLNEKDVLLESLREDFEAAVCESRLASLELQQCEEAGATCSDLSEEVKQLKTSRKEDERRLAATESFVAQLREEIQRLLFVETSQAEQSERSKEYQAACVEYQERVESAEALISQLQQTEALHSVTAQRESNAKDSEIQRLWRRIEDVQSEQEDCLQRKESARIKLVQLQDTSAIEVSALASSLMEKEELLARMKEELDAAVSEARVRETSLEHLEEARALVAKMQEEANAHQQASDEYLQRRSSAELKLVQLRDSSQDEVATLTFSLDEKDALIAKMREEIQAARSEVTNLQEEANAHQQASDEYLQRRSSAEIKLVQLRDSSQDEVATLTFSLDEKDALMAKMREEIQAAHSEVRSTSIELGQFEETNTLALEGTSRHLAELVEEINGFRAAREKEENQVEAAEAMVAQLREDIDKLDMSSQRVLSQQSKEMEDLKAEKAEYMLRAESSEALIKELHSQSEGLEASRTEVLQRRISAEFKFGQLQETSKEEIFALKSTLNEKDVLIGKATGDLEAVVAEARAARNEVGELEEASTMLAAKAEELLQRRTSVDLKFGQLQESSKEEIWALTASLNEKDALLAKTTGDLEAAVSDACKARDELDELEMASNMFAEKADTTSTSIAELLDEVHWLTAARKEDEQRLDTAENLVAEFHEEVLRLRSEEHVLSQHREGSKEFEAVHAECKQRAESAESLVSQMRAETEEIQEANAEYVQRKKSAEILLGELKEVYNSPRSSNSSDSEYSQKATQVPKSADWPSQDWSHSENDRGKEMAFESFNDSYQVENSAEFRTSGLEGSKDIATWPETVPTTQFDERPNGSLTTSQNFDTHDMKSDAIANTFHDNTWISEGEPGFGASGLDDSKDIGTWSETGPTTQFDEWPSSSLATPQNFDKNDMESDTLANTFGDTMLQTSADWPDTDPTWPSPEKDQAELDGFTASAEWPDSSQTEWMPLNTVGEQDCFIADSVSESPPTFRSSVWPETGSSTWTVATEPAGVDPAATEELQKQEDKSKQPNYASLSESSSSDESSSEDDSNEDDLDAVARIHSGHKFLVSPSGEIQVDSHQVTEFEPDTPTEVPFEHSVTQTSESDYSQKATQLPKSVDWPSQETNWNHSENDRAKEVAFESFNDSYQVENSPEVGTSGLEGSKDIATWPEIVPTTQFDQRSDGSGFGTSSLEDSKDIATWPETVPTTQFDERPDGSGFGTSNLECSKDIATWPETVPTTQFDDRPDGSGFGASGLDGSKDTGIWSQTLPTTQFDEWPSSSLTTPQNFDKSDMESDTLANSFGDSMLQTSTDWPDTDPTWPSSEKDQAELDGFTASAEWPDSSQTQWMPLNTVSEPYCFRADSACEHPVDVQAPVVACICGVVFPAEYSRFCRKCGTKRPEPNEQEDSNDAQVQPQETLQSQALQCLSRAANNGSLERELTSSTAQDNRQAICALPACDKPAVDGAGGYCSNAHRDHAAAYNLYACKLPGCSDLASMDTPGYCSSSHQNHPICRFAGCRNPTFDSLPGLCSDHRNHPICWVPGCGCYTLTLDVPYCGAAHKVVQPCEPQRMQITPVHTGSKDSDFFETFEAKEATWQGPSVVELWESDTTRPSAVEPWESDTNTFPQTAAQTWDTEEATWQGPSAAELWGSDTNRPFAVEPWESDTNTFPQPSAQTWDTEEVGDSPPRNWDTNLYPVPTSPPVTFRPRRDSDLSDGQPQAPKLRKRSFEDEAWPQSIGVEKQKTESDTWPQSIGVEKQKTESDTSSNSHRSSSSENSSDIDPFEGGSAEFAPETKSFTEDLLEPFEDGTADFARREVFKADMCGDHMEGNAILKTDSANDLNPFSQGFTSLQPEDEEINHDMLSSSDSSDDDPHDNIPGKQVDPGSLFEPWLQASVSQDDSVENALFGEKVAFESWGPDGNLPTSKVVEEETFTRILPGASDSRVDRFESKPLSESVASEGYNPFLDTLPSVRGPLFDNEGGEDDPFSDEPSQKQANNLNGFSHFWSQLDTKQERFPPGKFDWRLDDFAENVGTSGSWPALQVASGPIAARAANVEVLRPNERNTLSGIADSQGYQAAIDKSSIGATTSRGASSNAGQLSASTSYPTPALRRIPTPEEISGDVGFKISPVPNRAAWDEYS